MLDTVEVRNPQGSLLRLPLQNSISGVYIETIDGLDPVKATLVSSSFAGLDGEQYQSSRREQRNIIAKLILDPDYSVDSVESLRLRMYSFFMPKSEVNLRFIMSHGLVVDIDGRVETCQAPIFTQEPALDLSILCFDSNFYGSEILLSGNTVSSEVESTISYAGSIESGFVFTLMPNRAINDFTVYNRLPDGTLRAMDFSAPMLSGDVLTISTIPGNKYAVLNRGGTESSVLYGLSAFANWLQLYPGDNHMRIYAEGAGVPYTIRYTDKYGGL